MSAQSMPGSDWIVEGLAEYYSLETLHRSGTISGERFEKAHADLLVWGETSGPLNSDRSSGPITARAVGVLRAIDAEIRTSSGGAHSLDDVARQLTNEGKPITTERFLELATAAAGAPLRSMPDFSKN
jgi:predicted metalloprotease with PDZ domain